ncbi:hypothetical protein KR009_001012 [Drosophila setifemur]|nr:hypothetical protein KR009_001012 [Drosophila setifemur]
MARIHFIFGLVKVLRYPLSIFGFLQLKYIKSQKSFQQRDSCYRFVPVLLVTLILVLYLDRRVQLQKENDLVNSLKIESRPVENWFDKWNDDLQVMSIFLVMIWSLFRRALLWHLVNDAQLAHKKLKSLLGKRLTFNCSWLVFNYGIILTLLLIIFLGKILYLDLPHKESEANTITQKDLYEFLNYAMGLPRLMFVMIMALHILYHLINAGWLYSLANLRLPRNPKLFKFQLENLFPFQKRANLLAGLYFRVSYILFFWMVVIRLSDFLRHCRFDTKEFAQLQKSLDDREDEAEWDGVDFEKLETSEDLLFKTSLTLSWHLAMWMLLIASAYTQQEEYYNLIEESFEVEFDGKDLETKGFLSENSWNGHTFNKLDIIDMLVGYYKIFIFISKFTNIYIFLQFHSGVCIGDLQSNSICFLTDRLTKKKSSYIDLDCVAGPFKFILNLSISAALGYFAQQLELRHLQAFIKQEA